MKLPINNWIKILLVTAFLAASVIGFMVKLPSGFRHIDKELHAAFYFLAAAFLNVLFAGRKVTLHVLIFIFLFLFGIGVEYAQEYSNKLLHVKIHGRFDPEDVQSNLKGLIAFSIVWLVYIVLLFVYNKAIVKQAVSKSE
ncbi:MAG: hypothetical protein JWR61_4120 [Ferruginibacter sp.]|uniref:hypothetical protein n=1 Tax=Ferruginibacter sp. TaxID=1940288 RepID=UPI00265AA35D|nr:hypothetical protein [Ferruginibacter sp.]MDB5279165.1 hypothetical protein [Ferruginibacter sp.]